MSEEINIDNLRVIKRSSFALLRGAPVNKTSINLNDSDDE